MPDTVTLIAEHGKTALKRGAIVFGMSLLIGGLINFFSPSVSWSLDPDYRLEFWITLCLVGGIGILVCDLLLEWRLTKLHAGMSLLFQSICGTIAVLIPLYVLYDLEELPTVPRTVLFVWAVMALIVAGVYTIRHLSGNPSGPAPSAPVVETVIGRPKILSRLPIHLQGADLYALSAEDHYVRVHTSNGDDILLMRLSDSIEQAGGVEGTQTHRSWWVAKDAVSDIKKQGRSGQITLKNGQAVPVSRSALKVLKGMGWI